MTPEEVRVRGRRVGLQKEMGNHIPDKKNCPILPTPERKFKVKWRESGARGLLVRS